jgi:hypothetical protein
MPKRKTEVRTVNAYLEFLMDRVMSIQLILSGDGYSSVNCFLYVQLLSS